jgi:hypothetical protein
MRLSAARVAEPVVAQDETKVRRPERDRRNDWHRVPWAPIRTTISGLARHVTWFSGIACASGREGDAGTDYGVEENSLRAAFWLHRWYFA